MRKLTVFALMGAFTLAAPAFADDLPPNGGTTVNNYNSPPPPATVQPAPAPAPVVVVPQDTRPAPVLVQPTTTSETDTVYRPHAGLVWGGATIFGVSYGAAAIAAAASNDICNATDYSCVGSDRKLLYIPVAGPFIAMGSVNGTGSSTAKTLLALDGAFQAGGIAMSLTGLILSARPERVNRRTTVSKVNVSPFATPTTTGLGASGSF